MPSDAPLRAQQALQAQLAAATTASNGLVGYSTATAGGTQLLATGTLLQGSTSPVGAATIDVYLAGKRSPMLGSGAFFVQSGERWGIDPRLVVAIAGAESAFGTQTCGPFNAWGWSCPGSPAAFASWGAAIETITQGLREGYVDDGLTTVARIQTRYAPSQAANDPTGLNNNWVGNVSKFLTEQGGDPNAIAMAAPAAPTTSN